MNDFLWLKKLNDLTLKGLCFPREEHEPRLLLGHNTLSLAVWWLLKTVPMQRVGNEVDELLACERSLKHLKNCQCHVLQNWHCH